MKKTWMTSLIAAALVLTVLVGVAIPLISYAASDKLTVTKGKVLSLEEPLGIEGTPVFSWVVTSAKRGDSQKNYRLVVAKSEDDAKNGKAALWDTGKVSSANTTNVVYEGPALESRTSYY